MSGRRGLRSRRAAPSRPAWTMVEFRSWIGLHYGVLKKSAAALRSAVMSTTVGVGARRGSGVAGSARISSIDIVRGAVMVLMAIDHVRVYSGLPAGGPSAGIFFTRWVTHFCAPAFIFLAGTSAFMYARRHPDVSRFLVTRGLWLILLELTILRVAWTFNVDFGG